MTIPAEIKNAIKNNTLVLFVGSGSSKRFDLPDWIKLVNDVINELDKKNYNVFLPVLSIGAMTALEVLDKLQTDHNIIRKYIKTNFNILNGDYTFHQKLLQLSNKIITTNYDDAFEKASEGKILPTMYTSDYNVSEVNKTDDPYILKLHGTFSEPDNCIIFTKDYENLYNTDKSAIQKLKSIFTEKTILFLGFSFSDHDINLIFENLDKSFSNNNKHFVLTTDSSHFDEFKFLEKIIISNFDEVEVFVDQCLDYKKGNQVTVVPDVKFVSLIQPSQIPKVALLSPNPIDVSIFDDLSKVISYFYNLNIELHLGALNLKTLNTIEDYDILIIVSRVFKTNIYIEADDLKSSLISTYDICQNVPNDKIPIIFITDDKIKLPIGYSTINIFSFKNSIITKFIYKALKSLDLNFIEEEIQINLSTIIVAPLERGTARISSIYNNSQGLEIGKKALTSVVGRIEEQSALASRLLSIRITNKFLNIKASGGTGKTTLIKKVAYELYNRGYFKEGVNFKSCEHIATYEDFEEIVIAGFDLINILDFKEHLTANYSFQKKDLLIILDNFETVVNSLNSADFTKAIDLLKFVTDYANIVLTSREKISSADDFEDVYSLTPLTTDDAYNLFVKNYGNIHESEIKILRSDILEDLLNNNPLAIKLVTNSRTTFNRIKELRDQLKEHFFESTNEDYSSVYSSSADLNIERTKSLFQSINYSYTTLSNSEKLAFELLHLFPDGMSLSNFKKCFEKKNSSNKISDKELRTLRDKSLLEDYNGILQLQPIIRRFAEYQFSKRSKDIKKKYCLDAYLFNCFILDVIEFIGKKKTLSESYKAFNVYKNNLLNVLSYIPDVIIKPKSQVPEKKYLLHYLYSIHPYMGNEKTVLEYKDKVGQLVDYFADSPNADLLIKVLTNYLSYFHEEFDYSYRELEKLLSVVEMEERDFEKEDSTEILYKDYISSVHSMEGHTLQYINSKIKNDFNVTELLIQDFFYLGIPNHILGKDRSFYTFESELMLNQLEIDLLENYIKSLYQDEHLEIMQCTYTLAKVKVLELGRIQKLVVTNPYTRGLKELMLAFISENEFEKSKHFKKALTKLHHIKYYYLEALYYYCLFLKENFSPDFDDNQKLGLRLSMEYSYQYLHFLFLNLNKKNADSYNFDYSYFSIENLEKFVNKHNEKWAKIFRQRK